MLASCMICKPPTAYHLLPYNNDHAEMFHAPWGLWYQSNSDDDDDDEGYMHSYDPSYAGNTIANNPHFLLVPFTTFPFIFIDNTGLRYHAQHLPAYVSQLKYSNHILCRTIQPLTVSRLREEQGPYLIDEKNPTPFIQSKVQHLSSLVYASDPMTYTNSGTMQ